MVFNSMGNKYLKKYAENKALPIAPRKTHRTRLDCGELRQCHRCPPFFIYK